MKETQPPHHVTMEGSPSEDRTTDPMVVDGARESETHQASPDPAHTADMHQEDGMDGEVDDVQLKAALDTDAIAGALDFSSLTRLCVATKGFNGKTVRCRPTHKGK